MGEISPFLERPEEQWLASNDLAFAIFDQFPVSPGHALVITKRVVPTFFDASPEDQAAMTALVVEVKNLLLQRLDPKPDGFNVGFNAGSAAGQTVHHVHIHVIPRYDGDVLDPRGGVRHVIPEKANYLVAPSKSSGKSAPQAAQELALSTGHPDDPLWDRISPRLNGAEEIDILASFVQLSGLDVIEAELFAAIHSGARVRILVGDYLYISDPRALGRLNGWLDTLAQDLGSGRLEVCLLEMENLINPKTTSFHPKAWRIADDCGGMVVVGSSNLSAPALRTGVEWNAVASSLPAGDLDSQLEDAFTQLWEIATPVSEDVVDRYASAAKLKRRESHEPEAEDLPLPLPYPRPWQQKALRRLGEIRSSEHQRALVAVATGLGKTWLAAFDIVALGQELGRRPRVLVIAHRAEILAQAETAIRRALDERWSETAVGWYLGGQSDLAGDLTIASIQKLSRPDSLADLEGAEFDYAIIDEVHHAHAPSYRKVLARLRARFTLGLTATPERADGVDVAALFDDILAWHATIGDGIEEGALVPFHYVGLKDEVDFRQIPWRNGRFDPGVLEERVENSARMQRLWEAWHDHDASKTVVFCCSQRHALFTRNWLAGNGVRAAAVFAGTDSDPRGGSVRALLNGDLDALCVVDLFNEGVDLPAVDRVVMLRPTESKVVFLQQLGRGLRAADDKSRLLVIDFIGNHRLFGQRILHLLSLRGAAANWSQLELWIGGEDPTPVLPPGCLLDVELEAKDLLQQVLPTGGGAAVDAYRAMRDELGRRPTLAELFHRGYLPSVIRAAHEQWFNFVATEGDLVGDESSTLEANAEWFRMLELTALNRSFKMVVLRVLLDRDALWRGMEIGELATACRKFLLAHPHLKGDLAPTNAIPDHEIADDEDWTAWWLQWPLSRWLDQQAGRVWFVREDNQFRINLKVPETERADFSAMTGEVVDYRLAQYVASRLQPATEGNQITFMAKVSHSGGRPILFLPTKEKCPGRPVGPTDLTLPDGSIWEFRFVKVACNVATPKGEKDNRLPDLLRNWFGDDAGAPGTGFHVRFTSDEEGWHVEPIQPAGEKANATPIAATPKVPLASLHLEQDPPETHRYTQLVPAYDLEAAAGLWGPDHEPEDIGWTPVEGVHLQEGMFVARVNGHSMEPLIPSGSWCLFRRVPAGSREGRILLIQLHTMTDPEDGGRYTVKRYHSEKSPSEDGGWEHQRIELRPENTDYDPIVVTDEHEANELLVVGEFVQLQRNG